MLTDVEILAVGRRSSGKKDEPTQLVVVASYLLAAKVSLDCQAGEQATAEQTSAVSTKVLRSLI